MPDGLGDAVSRWAGSNDEPMEETGKTESETSSAGDGKGHTFHIHKHKDGKHHLTVHGEHGQLVHHSEHDSLEEAAEEMKQHGDSVTTACAWRRHSSIPNASLTERVLRIFFTFGITGFTPGLSKEARY